MSTVLQHKTHSLQHESQIKYAVLSGNIDFVVHIDR